MGSVNSRKVVTEAAPVSNPSRILACGCFLAKMNALKQAIVKSIKKRSYNFYHKESHRTEHRQEKDEYPRHNQFTEDQPIYGRKDGAGEIGSDFNSISSFMVVLLEFAFLPAHSSPTHTAVE